MAGIGDAGLPMGYALENEGQAVGAGLKPARTGGAERNPTTAGDGGRLPSDCKTRVCANPACIHGGKPQPVTNFGRHPRTKDFMQHQCSDCLGVIKKKSWAKKKALPLEPQEKGAAVLEADIAVGAGLKPARTIVKKNDFLIVDFSEHPDLLDRLKRIAKNQFRTPEHQVLHWIQSEGEWIRGDVGTALPRVAD